MAVALSNPFSWMTTSSSSIKLSYYTFSSVNASSYSTLHHRKSSYLNTLPLLTSLSSSCYCCLEADKYSKKPIGTRNLFDKGENFSTSHSSRLEPNARNNSSRVTITKKRLLMSLKYILRKRSWRRILSASKKARSIILLNVITLVYASNIAVVKQIQAAMDPASFTVVRFAVSAIPFLPFVYKARHDAQTRRAGVELGLWVSLGYLMQAFGLLTSDVGRASFISMLTVIVVPVLDGLLGAVVPTRTWFGAFMCLVGVGLLESSGSPPCIGDLLNFLSAFFFGVHMLRTEQISRVTDKDKFISLLGYEVIIVALLSLMWYLIGGWISGTQVWASHSWSWARLLHSLISFPWVPALYTGVFSTGLCLWVEMAAMRDVSATETAVVYALEPVWGAGFAWFLLGERWGAIGWIGAALVLAGSLAVQIFGSVPPSDTTDDEDPDEKEGCQVTIAKQNALSPST